MKIKALKKLYPNKTIDELKSSLLLFYLLESSAIVLIALQIWKILNFFKIPLKPLISLTGYNQFCAGETIEECNHVAEKLERYGVYSVFDYNIEHSFFEHDFEKNLESILNTIKYQKKNNKLNFCVVKPSSIGHFLIYEKKSQNFFLSESENEKWNKILKRFDILAKHAENSNVVLMIDSEESWIQRAIDEIIISLMKKYNNKKVVVATTIQLYLKNRDNYYREHLKKSKELNFIYAVKIVRGAYMQKETKRSKNLGIDNPICSSKNVTDKQFRNAIKIGIQNSKNHLCIIATHNEDDIQYTIRLCKKLKIKLQNNNIWFSQLYGMRDYISFSLSSKKINVLKYIPFGPLNLSVPYLIRRAIENSSVKKQLRKERKMIKSEIKKRKFIL